MCYFYGNCCKCLYTFGTVTFLDALFCCYCFFFFPPRIITVCSHPADKHLRSTSLSFKDWTLFPHHSHHEYTKTPNLYIYIYTYIQGNQLQCGRVFIFKLWELFPESINIRERERKKKTQSTKAAMTLAYFHIKFEAPFGSPRTLSCEVHINP